jgi:hypothetical protein
VIRSGEAVSISAAIVAVAASVQVAKRVLKLDHNLEVL